MDRQKFLNRFQFDDKMIGDQQIDPKSLFEVTALISNRQDHLPLARDACFPQLICETCFVHRFQKSGAQGTMNFNRTTDNQTGQLIAFVGNSCE